MVSGEKGRECHSLDKGPDPGGAKRKAEELGWWSGARQSRGAADRGRGDRLKGVSTDKGVERIQQHRSRPGSAGKGNG